MIFRSQKTIHIPEVPLHEALFFNVDDYGDRVALIDGETGKSYTYPQLMQAVRSVASALSKQGIKKGDVVAYHAPNSVDLSVALFGCMSVGAVISGANFNYTAYELHHQVSDLKAKVLLTIANNLPTVQEVQKKCNIQTIITLDERVPNHVFIGDMLKDNGSAYPQGLIFNVHEDLFAIMYSSGTTGLPKGVMLSHYNMVATMMLSRASRSPPYPGQDITLGFIPTFHMFGMAQLCLSVQFGLTFVAVPGFKPERFLETIQTYKVTLLYIVPPVAVFLAKSPLVKNYDISSVKGVFCGAAPLTEDTEKQFLQKVKVGHINQAYGMTELTTFGALGLSGNKYGSAGLLVANTAAKVMSTTTGKSLSVGEEGELWVKGPQVMKGYLNRPDATKDMIDSEGWLHTGDVAYFDKDGDLFVTGRIKELIKHKGFQVAPAELEGLIMTHPGVDDAAVIGISDTAAGELPRAFVVRKPQSTVTTKEIYDFVKGHLSRHKWLSGGVQFVSQIPKTASGKIIRRDVAKLMTNSKL